MAYKPSQSKAVTKYIAKAYDQVSLRIPKGTREKYKNHAESKGKSLNALIVELLEADIAGQAEPTEQ
ncbi:MAG: Arc family DNA-binding protein [Ruminococcus sp.]|nr:Arc family DNA-binding protein [Ruminococcus sp.]